jgi:hypothetical protein
VYTWLFAASALSSLRADVVDFREGDSPSAAYQHLGAQGLQNDPNGNSGGDIFLRAGWGFGGGPGTPIIQRPFRTVLGFDLGAIPSGSTIRSATLKLAIAEDDNANSINGLELHQVVLGANMIEGTGLQAAPTTDGVTWTEIRPGESWTTPGGDYLPAVLSSIGPDPDGGTGGEVYTFSTSTDFVSAAQSALDSNLPLELLIRSAAAEANGGSIQNFYRFASDDHANVSLRPQLTIEFVSEPNSDPIADAGPDQTLECELPDGSLVLLDGTGSFDPDGDGLEYEWSAADGSGVDFDDPTSATPMGLFPVGPTLVTLTVTDGNGGIDVDDVLITVVDTTPPVVVCTTDEVALWPPNHEMMPVEVSVVASDECQHPEELILDCTVSSSEPDDATGDGAFDGDVDGLDGYTVPVPLELAYDPLTDSFTGTIFLRAERDGANTGRVYSIICDIEDPAGNVATSSCVVVVPHDRRKK